MLLNLAYHSISEKTYEHAVTPDMFERQLRFLKDRFEIVPTDQLPEILKRSHASKNTVSISFDDGVDDIYTNAFPILKKLNIPATVFVCTGLVGKTQTNASNVTFTFLTWEQMQEMQANRLIMIESHTHTHPLLTTLDDAILEQELITSKQEIQARLGSITEGFAYPKGNYDERVVATTKRHFSYAFGGVGAILPGTIVDPYIIPRVIVSANISMWKFKAMTHPWYWRLKYIRDQIRGRYL